MSAALTSFQTQKIDASKPPDVQLTKLLSEFDLTTPLPINGQMEVDLIQLVNDLPSHIEGETSPAYKVLYDYVYAIPPARRRKGLHVHAEHILSLLFERLEFFEGLSRSVVRVCKARRCVHFDVCPFKHVVANVQESEGIPCAVEREVVRNAVESFTMPQNGNRPKVDARRPEMALLFQQLVQLLVKQVRISMYLQQADIMIDQYEILKDGDMEKFDTANKAVHPLVDSWDKNHLAIQRVMKDMGLSVEFQIKQGLWIDESSQIDAEKRALELAQSMLIDAMKKQSKSLPAGSPELLSMEEAISHAQQQLAERGT